MVSYKEILFKYRYPRNEEIGLGMGSKYVYSPIAAVFVKLCLYLKITANQVTYSWLTLGFVGLALFLTNHPILAIITFQIAVMLDYVDGAIARVTKTSSMKGLYLEGIAHHFQTILVAIGITFYLFTQQNTLVVFALGFSIVVSYLMTSFITLSK